MKQRRASGITSANIPILTREILRPPNRRIPPNPQSLPRGNPNAIIADLL
jgi:hypothetical protein